MNAASTPVTPLVRAPQIADPAKYEGKTACVIGSGFGGMALAIRLQSAGIATTVIESRDKPGGRAYFWEKDGFIFDGGPTVVKSFGKSPATTWPKMWS
jgi:phytoene desaturase